MRLTHADGLLDQAVLIRLELDVEAILRARGVALCLVEPGRVGRQTLTADSSECGSRRRLRACALLLELGQLAVVLGDHIRVELHIKRRRLDLLGSERVGLETERRARARDEQQALDLASSCVCEPFLKRARTPVERGVLLEVERSVCRQHDGLQCARLARRLRDLRRPRSLRVVLVDVHRGKRRKSSLFSRAPCLQRLEIWPLTATTKTLPSTAMRRRAMRQSSRQRKQHRASPTAQLQHQLTRTERRRRLTTMARPRWRTRATTFV